MNHTFDSMTLFCTSCGVNLRTAAARVGECHGGGNVIAISHIIARKRLRETSGLPINLRPRLRNRVRLIPRNSLNIQGDPRGTDDNSGGHAA